MSKYTKLIMCLVFSAALLVGSFGVVSAKDIEIRFYHCCGQDYRNALYAEFSREFEKLNPGVKILDSFPGGGGYSDSIKVAIAGGLAPDVMWMGNGMWNFIDQLLPLDDMYKTVPMIKEILPGVIQSHMWEGHLKAIPFGLNTHAIFYNQNMLAAAGIAMPKDWTWDDAINMTKKLTKDTNSDGTMDQYGFQFSELTHVLTQGGDHFTPDMRKVNYNNPATIAATQLYADLTLGVYGPYPTGAAKANFIASKVAMTNLGVFESDVIAPAVTFDWDVQLFPKLVVNGKETRTSWNSSEAWVAYGATKYPDIVKAFITFLVSKENMNKFAVTRAVIPSQPSVAVGSFLKLNLPKSIHVFTDALSWWKKNSAHPSGLAPSTGDYYSQIFNGSMPAAQAIPEMEIFQNKFLDDYWANRGK